MWPDWTVPARSTDQGPGRPRPRRPSRPPRPEYGMREHRGRRALAVLAIPALTPGMQEHSALKCSRNTRVDPREVRTRASSRASCSRVPATRTGAVPLGTGDRTPRDGQPYRERRATVPGAAGDRTPSGGRPYPASVAGGRPEAVTAVVANDCSSGSRPVRDAKAAAGFAGPLRTRATHSAVAYLLGQGAVYGTRSTC
jgi:hypothetical protein